MNRAWWTQRTIAAGGSAARRRRGREGSPQTFALDDQEDDLVAAFSTRRLLTSFAGSGLRVRRSSDNTEDDIGFESDGDLDESALTTFVGAGSGYGPTWYEQGPAGDATQATAANQPRIVNSGAVEKINTRPAFRFLSASSTKLKAASSIIDLAKKHTYYFVAQEQTIHDGTLLVSAVTADGINIRFRNNGGTGQIRYFTNGVIDDFNHGITAGTAAVITVVADHDSATAGQPRIYVNGTLIGTGTSRTTDSAHDGADLFIGGSGAEFLNGHLGECLIFDVAHSNATRQAIETDLQTYWGT